MDQDLYNADFFDFKKLAVPERFVKTKTNNCEYVFNACIGVASANANIGLITEPGYSARSGIEDFIKNTRKYRYYFGLCARANGLKTILTDFLMQELPTFVKITETTEGYLTSALGHHFKNLDVKRQRIIIFYNLENLTGLRHFGTIYKLADDVKDHAGILVSINSAKFKQLQNLAEKHSDINNFLSVFEWKELPPPSLGELGQHCFNRGVLGKKVVDRLLRKATDFRILNMEINKIVKLLATRGYLKDPNV